MSSWLGRPLVVAAKVWRAVVARPAELARLALLSIRAGIRLRTLQCLGLQVSVRMHNRTWNMANLRIVRIYMAFWIAG